MFRLDHTVPIADRQRQIRNAMVFTFLVFILLLSMGVFAQSSTLGWDNRNAPTSKHFEDVISPDGVTVVAVGGSGSIYTSTNTGINWTSMHSGVTADLKAIDYQNNTYVAVGSSGTVIRNENNKGWQDISPTTTITLYGVSISNSTSATHFSVYVCGTDGEIWFSNDSGSNWVKQDTGTTATLNSIDFINGTTGLAVGAQGTVLGTIDGQNWSSRDVPTQVGTNDLRTVDFINGARAFIAGDNGIFLRSTKTEAVIGFQWTYWDTKTTLQINAISSSSVNKVWLAASNGTVMLTSDGGYSFTSQKVNNTYAGTDFNGIYMYNSTHGYVVGDAGSVMFTNRSGIANSGTKDIRNYNNLNTLLKFALPLLFQGFIGTVQIVYLALILGFSLGVIFALMKTVNFAPARFLGMLYTDTFRNTPLIVQFFIVQFGFPTIGIDLTFGGHFVREYISAIIALGTNSGAYQAEIIRAGIQAIPSGQMEAGRSLGLTYPQAMRFVILPQAIRIVIPPLGNEAVNVILNSSLAYTIGYFEITRAGRLIIGTTFQIFNTWMMVLLFFFVITYSIANLLKVVERKSKIPGLGLAGEV